MIDLWMRECDRLSSRRRTRIGYSICTTMALGLGLVGGVLSNTLFATSAAPAVLVAAEPPPSMLEAAKESAGQPAI